MSRRPDAPPAEGASNERVVTSRLKTVLSFGAEALKPRSPVVAQKLEVVNETPLSSKLSFKPQYKVVPPSTDVPPVTEFVDISESLMQKRFESSDSNVAVTAAKPMSPPLLPETLKLERLRAAGRDPFVQDFDFSSLIDNMHTVLSYNHGTENNLEEIASMLDTLRGAHDTDVRYGKETVGRDAPPAGQEGYGVAPPPQSAGGAQAMDVDDPSTLMPPPPPRGRPPAPQQPSAPPSQNTDAERGQLFDRSNDAALTPDQLAFLEQKRLALLQARQGYRSERVRVDDEGNEIREVQDLAPFLMAPQRPTGREGPTPEQPPRPLEVEELRWMNELKRSGNALAALQAAGKAPRPSLVTDAERYPNWIHEVTFGLDAYPGWIMPPPTIIPDTQLSTEYRKIVAEWDNPKFWEDLGAKKIYDNGYGEEELIFFAADGVTRVPPHVFYKEWREEKEAAINAAAELVKAFKRATAKFKDRTMDPTYASAMAKRRNLRPDDEQARAYNDRLDERRRWEGKMQTYNNALEQHYQMMDRYLASIDKVTDSARLERMMKAFIDKVPQAPPPFEEEYVPNPRLPASQWKRTRRDLKRAVVATRDDALDRRYFIKNEKGERVEVDSGSRSTLSSGSTKWMTLVHPRARGYEAAGAADEAEAEERRKEDIAFAAVLKQMPEGREKEAAKRQHAEKTKTRAQTIRFLKEQKFPSYQLPGPSGDYVLTIKRWIPVSLVGEGTWVPGAEMRSWRIPEHLREEYPKPGTNGKEFFKTKQCYCIPDPVSMVTRKIRAGETINVKKWDEISMMRGDQLWPDPAAIARAISKLPLDPVTQKPDPYEYLTYPDGTIMTFDPYGFPKPYDESKKLKTRLAAGEWEWILPPKREVQMQAEAAAKAIDYERIIRMADQPGPFEQPLPPLPPSDAPPKVVNPNIFDDDIDPMEGDGGGDGDSDSDDTSERS